MANLATEMPHCRPMRPPIRWLRRRYEPDDEISFQGVEYDEKTGKMKLKPVTKCRLTPSPASSRTVGLPTIEAGTPTVKAIPLKTAFQGALE
jgi:hypothetical protein